MCKHVQIWLHMPLSMCNQKAPAWGGVWLTSEIVCISRATIILKGKRKEHTRQSVSSCLGGSSSDGLRLTQPTTMTTLALAESGGTSQLGFPTEAVVAVVVVRLEIIEKFH